MKSRFGTALLIILVCFLTRLPLLLSPELILDGDECVIAMMAKHTIEGKSAPLFFYGQNYGFAFFEVLLSALFFLLLGYKTIAVKLAILSLWTTGLVFFYLALRRVAANPKWLDLIVALLLLASPAWLVFSMKAYGGYVTAFTLSNIILWMIFSTAARPGFIFFAV
jgi:hypothetical protein